MTEAAVEMYLLSGAGNDFLAQVEPEADPTPEQVRAWCRRGISLGADGLFVLRRSRVRDGVAPTASVPRVSMDHWNPDGGRADLCANGARCAVRLAAELGWLGEGVSGTSGAHVILETGAGALAARLSGPDRVELQAPLPAAAPEELALEVDGERFQGYRVEVGVPYFVLPWDETSLEDAPLERLGPPLRHHPRLVPEGANVDFVRFPGSEVASGSGIGRLEMRVWERGVEAETLASGTGALAAALVAVHAGRGTFPLEVATAAGFVLTVGGTPAEAVPPERWTLTGDARLLARLEVFAGALSSP